MGENEPSAERRRGSLGRECRQNPTHTPKLESKGKLVVGGVAGRGRLFFLNSMIKVKITFCIKYQYYEFMLTAKPYLYITSKAKNMTES